MSDSRVSVFLSYAHEDDAERVELRKQLRGLRADDGERLLDLWDDRQIPAGGLWDDEIKVALTSADIVIFLISSDFIDSEYIEHNEMRGALEQREKDETEVIPVLLKHCPWKGTGLERFNVIPSDERWVVGGWSGLAEPLNLVAEEVRKVALDVIKKRDLAAERRERYREKVAETLSDGVISYGEQKTLDELQAELHLPDEVAAQIRAGEIQPIERLRKHRDRYRETLAHLVNRSGHPLGDFDRNDIATRQRDLGLTDEDIAGIEDEVVEAWEAAQAATETFPLGDVPPEPDPLTRGAVGDHLDVVVDEHAPERAGATVRADALRDGGVEEPPSDALDAIDRLGAALSGGESTNEVVELGDPAQRQRITQLVSRGKKRAYRREFPLYLGRYPNDVWMWSLYAGAHRETGDPATALTILDEAITHNPEADALYVGKGLVLRMVDDFEAALENYRTAVSLNPENGEVFTNMSVISLRLGLDAEALKLAQRANELLPQDPTVVRNLALAYHFNEMFDERDEVTELLERWGEVQNLHSIYSGRQSIR